MPAPGPITLRIIPVATLPGQQGAGVLGDGHAFLAAGADGQPIEAHFNANVTIRFPYSDAELVQKRISERKLTPAYFFTTTAEWTIPEVLALDTTHNTLVSVAWPVILWGFCTGRSMKGTVLLGLTSLGQHLSDE